MYDNTISNGYEPPAIPQVFEVTDADLVETSHSDAENSQPNPWRWGCGCLLALGALSCGNFLMMLVWLAMAAVLIPPSAKKIEEYFEIELDRKLMTNILIGGGVATILLAAMMAGSGMQSGGGADYDKWIDRVGEIGSPMP